MAITNGYATLAELKARMTDGTYSVDDDDALETIIEAASRWIDDHTQAKFYASTETRYYTPEFYDILFLPDDLLSVTTLKTDDNGDGTYETTWTASDYVLQPRNASLNNEPYRQIEINRNLGDYSLPQNVQDGVEIAGSWGYASSAPAPVKEACLLLSQRLWMRKDAVFGVVGGGNIGSVAVIQAKIEQDQDIIALLTGISRRGW